MTTIDIVILAAGEGKRMGEGLPKVLRPVLGIPILQRIINTVSQLNDIQNIYVIVSKKLMKNDNFQSFFNLNQKIKFLLQGDEKGTAKAVEPYIILNNTSKAEFVMVLAGDTPLLESDMLQLFVSDFFKSKKQAGIIAFEPNDGKQYGRIINNKIIEYKDCNVDEREIKLCNTGIYLFDNNILEKNLPKVTNNNTQKEFYLTDIFNFLDKSIIYCYVVQNEYNYQFHGINTIEDFIECESIMQSKSKYY